MTLLIVGRLLFVLMLMLGALCFIFPTCWPLGAALIAVCIACGSVYIHLDRVERSK